jgi:hypothetical protein
LGFGENTISIEAEVLFDKFLIEFQEEDNFWGLQKEDKLWKLLEEDKFIITVYSPPTISINTQEISTGILIALKTAPETISPLKQLSISHVDSINFSPNCSSNEHSR